LFRSNGSHASRINSISEVNILILLFIFKFQLCSFKSADSFGDWARRNTAITTNQILIDDIPETNMTPFSASSLSNVSTTSRLEKTTMLE